jgi:hypothetical protein
LGEASSQTVVIDFEEPRLNGWLALSAGGCWVDRTNVTFSVGSEYRTFGLVSNQASCACVPPADTDQKLGIGSTAEGTIGRSGCPVQATFPCALVGGTTVSVDVQTMEGASIRMRLYDAKAKLVAETIEVSSRGAGTCHMPGSDRSVSTLSASTERPVAYVIIDVPRDLNDIWYVFVLDNFSFEVSAAALGVAPNCDHPFQL